MGMTQEAKKNSQKVVRALIDGRVNFDGLIESTSRKPFSYYLQRFISEKTGKKAEAVTHFDVCDYCEKQTKLLSDDLKGKLEELHKDNVYKQVIRRCFDVEKDRAEFPEKLKKHQEYIVAHKEEYEEYCKLKKQYNNIKDKTKKAKQEKKRLKEMLEEYPSEFKKPEGPREMTRGNLMKLFFRLNCNEIEAEELLWRLGEPTFYHKNRAEALVWWSLRQKNKFETYCNLKYLLHEPRTTITFGGEPTGFVFDGFKAIDINDEESFKRKLLQLETSNEKSKTRKEIFENIIKSIRKEYDDKFDESLEKKINKIREEIDSFYEQLDDTELPEKKARKKEIAIDDRYRKIEKLTYEYYHKHTSINRISKQMRAVANSNIKKFNYGRIYQLLKDNETNIEDNETNIEDNETNIGETKTGDLKDEISKDNILRYDIVTAVFIDFVLKNYYDRGAKSLDDTCWTDLEGNNDIRAFECSTKELVEEFKNSVDSALISGGFFQLNLCNPYEAFLVLCLATTSPLTHFCSYVHNYFSFGKSGDE